MPQNTQKKRRDRRRSSHPSHRSGGRIDGVGEKENRAPETVRGNGDDEIQRLRERASHLEQLCQSNGISIPDAVNGVPDRSIPRPHNTKKGTSVASIREHMGLADAENKRVWLTCRKSVRNNLTRAGFDHDVDFASQEKLKVANCLAAIEHECPLFKRFKGSWGAEYVLREVWSNRNEWADKTNAQLPDPEANNDANDNEDSHENPRNSDEDGGQRQQNEDEDDEGEDENPRPSLASGRKWAHELSPTPSEEDTDTAVAAPPKKRTRKE
ncbi:hypothetical protein B0H14DRAFT_3140574 [Mycena olivaceomarginata]|nr:hypothetical protein B0H14DRAFT_3140574 [Mycena olivaceomarginata]